jgi:hypothetical protein
VIVAGNGLTFPRGARLTEAIGGRGTARADAARRAIQATAIDVSFLEVPGLVDAAALRADPLLAIGADAIGVLSAASADRAERTGPAATVDVALVTVNDLVGA